jgi:hypothetical protein
VVVADIKHQDVLLVQDEELAAAIPGHKSQARGRVQMNNGKNLSDKVWQLYRGVDSVSNHWAA